MYITDLHDEDLEIAIKVSKDPLNFFLKSCCCVILIMGVLLNK